jgi:calcineurin-like phosphoesterase family protein
MQYFFISDEHFGHVNILKFCKRPFGTIQEMDDALISNYNSVVKPEDVVIHVGDFTLAPKHVAATYIARLKGKHVFIRGSHDRWMENDYTYLREFKINGQGIVACHYAMRVWPKSHYGTWQVFAHSHGRLKPEGKQWDVGVDNNNFFPVSFDQLIEIMKGLPDNFNLVRNRVKDNLGDES